MSGGGGQAQVGKWGRVLDGGGIDQIFANWGDPQSPPGKNPGYRYCKTCISRIRKKLHILASATHTKLE